MTDRLPDPFVPPDVDLRGFGKFLIDIDRLMASELVAIGTPEECWAAFMLWCRAWQQTPPASLPDDDKVLAAFSKSGKKWKKIRDVALRGWTKCADGRLYHRVLADVALDAWSKRKRYQDLSAKGNSARWRDPSGIPQGSASDVDGTPSRDPVSIPQGSLRDRREVEVEEKKKLSLVTPPLSPSQPDIRRAAPAGKKSSPSKPIVLPDWLPESEWSEFVAHRKGMKAPLTDEGKRRAINELAKLHDAGHDPAAVITQSIVRGYRGLFPVEHHTGGLNGTRRESAADRHARANAIHEQALARAAAELDGGLRGEDAGDVPRTVDGQVVVAH